MTATSPYRVLEDMLPLHTARRDSIACSLAKEPLPPAGINILDDGLDPLRSASWEELPLLAAGYRPRCKDYWNCYECAIHAAAMILLEKAP